MSAIEWIVRVPGDPVAVGAQDRLGLGVERRILDPGVREAGGDARVEIRVRRLVDDRAVVEALEIDRVDRAGRDERGDQLVAPVARRVELEAERRDSSRAGGSRARPSPARRAAARRRSVTGCGTQLEPVGERDRPPGAARGRARPTRTPSAGRGARPRARARPGRGRATPTSSEKPSSVCEPSSWLRRSGVLQRDVVERVVGDVLADTLLAAAAAGGSRSRGA